MVHYDNAECVDSVRGRWTTIPIKQYNAGAFEIFHNELFDGRRRDSQYMRRDIWFKNRC